MTTLLGTMTPCPIGKMLGRDDFKRFRSPHGLSGLACAEGSTLRILAIEADIHGTGALRSFVAQDAEEFVRVEFLCILNPVMDEILERYGFVESGVVDMVWTRD